MAFVFSEFRLDPEAHELTRNGTAVAVEPRTFQLLQTLLEAHDTLLTKEDLIEAVWRGRFTSDEAIASRVRDARKVLGDDGRTQKFIKTIHGVGYRFSGTLREGAQPSGVSRDGEPDPGDTDTRPVIVVTPFRDASGKDSVTALGLTHDVIIGLSRLRWLKVISHASSLRLQDSDAQALRPITMADYHLAAWIHLDRSQLQLAVELINLNDGAVVWAERFTARASRVNEVRADVVRQTVSSLEVQISASEAAKAQFLHTDNLDAWANYHLGLHHMYRFNARDNSAAMEFFRRAIAQQPDFARAHAGLSFTQFQAVFNRYGGNDIDACRIEAAASAERSVQLDASDPLANFVMGRSFWLDGDVEAGQPWLERALAINSSFAQAHYSFGLGAVMLGAVDSEAGDGHGEAAAAIALSPLDPFMYGFYGVRALSFLRDGDYGKGRLWANRAARQPNAIVAMDFIAAAANSLAGEEREARKWAARASQRHENADSGYFFRALPFSSGTLRDGLEGAFKELGLAERD